MGMLSLQADTMKDAGSIAALDNARRRMQSMMVLYDKLYRSEGFRCMSAKEYLVPLVHEIVENLPNHGGVVVETHVDDFILDAKHLSPVGIIVNELLTNIMKHAFAGREDGLVRVSASLKERRASIVVEDDGIGLPASFDFRTSSGFGMQVIEMLRVQIGGSLRIEHEKGTNVTLEFNV